MAAASPFFSELPLAAHGLNYIYPQVSAAHPFDGQPAALLHTSLEQTARELGQDRDAYTKLLGSLLEDWPGIAGAVLGPFRFPDHPVKMARFVLERKSVVQGKRGSVRVDLGECR